MGWAKIRPARWAFGVRFLGLWNGGEAVKFSKMKKMMIRYVALLRGINVGGHKPVKMEGLKKSFEAVGFEKVKTVLASGNVLFETEVADEEVLVAQIGARLKKDLGHEVGVLVRSMEEIQSLVERNPFKKIQV